MPLQFLHVDDLCRIMERIITTHPQHHILNVGNKTVMDINSYVEACYEVAGAALTKEYVNGPYRQRDYFCFHDYAYTLDVSLQHELLPTTKTFKEGLEEAFRWYVKHPDEVKKKDYLRFIDTHF